MRKLLVGKAEGEFWKLVGIFGKTFRAVLGVFVGKIASKWPPSHIENSGS